MLILVLTTTSNGLGYFACLDSSLKVSSVVKGEMSAKTTYQRSAKGPVSIAECHPNGNYITLENTSRKVRSKPYILDTYSTQT